MIKPNAIFFGMTFALISIQSQAAVDPMTAMAAISTAAQLFGPKGADVTLEVAKANRELLTKLHGKLDTIEGSIIRLMKDVHGLPKHMYRNSLKSQEKLYTDNLVSAGKVFVDLYTEALMYNLKGLNPEDKKYQQLVAEYKYDIKLRLAKIEEARGTLMLRSDLNATAVAVAAYIEISMHLVVNEYEGKVKALVSIYGGYFDKILDAQRVDSLSKLVVKVQTKREEQVKKIRKTHQLSAESPLESITYSACSTYRTIKNNPKTCSTTVFNGLDQGAGMGTHYTEEYDCSFVTRQDHNSVIIGYTVQSKPVALGTTTSTSYSVINTESALLGVIQKCPTNPDNYVAFKNTNNIKIADIKDSFLKLNKLSNLLVALKNTVTIVKTAQSWLNTVKEREVGTVKDIPLLIGNVRPILYANQNNEHIDQLFLDVEDKEKKDLRKRYRDHFTAERKSFEALLKDQEHRINEAIELSQEAAQFQTLMTFARFSYMVYVSYRALETEAPELTDVSITTKNQNITLDESEGGTQASIDDDDQSSQTSKSFQQATTDSQTNDTNLKLVAEIEKRLDYFDKNSLSKVIDPASQLTEKEKWIFESIAKIKKLGISKGDQIYKDYQKSISPEALGKSASKLLRPNPYKGWLDITLKAFSPNVVGDGTLVSENHIKTLKDRLEVHAQQAINNRLGDRGRSNSGFKEQIRKDFDRIERNEKYGSLRNKN